MKQTRTINLAGINFYLDEDAYIALEDYFKKLRIYFKHQPGDEEIISDIENRMAELFQQKLKSPQNVIKLDEVNEVISVLGKPGDFEQEETTAHAEDNYGNTKKRLFRDMDNSILGGVCSGLGAYLNIDQVWVRAVFLIAILSGVSLLLYLVMWIIIPPAKTTAEKLEMQGTPVNIKNIEKIIKEEMGNLKDKLEDLTEQAKNKFKRKK